MNKLKKGITLIALIITIVILLILAVVTINAIQGEGIISYAKNAQSGYTAANDEEKSMLNGYELILAQETGNAWKQNGTKVVKGDKVLNVGDTVTSYTYGDYTWKVLGAENGQLLLMTDEYVNDSFTCPAATQSFKGSVDALDAECVKRVLTDNDLTLEQIKATKVRSVRVEDINRVTGYDPTNPRYNAGYASQYGNTVRSFLSNGIVAWESYAPDGTLTKSGTSSFYKEKEFRTPDKKMLISSGGTAETGYIGVSEIEVTTDAYAYDGSLYLNPTSNAYKLLFGNWDSDMKFGDKSYLLASPFTGAFGEYALWGLRCVNSVGLDNEDFADSRGSGLGYPQLGRVLAVVSLSLEFQV